MNSDPLISSGDRSRRNQKASFAQIKLAGRAPIKAFMVVQLSLMASVTERLAIVSRNTTLMLN